MEERELQETTQPLSPGAEPIRRRLAALCFAAAAVVVCAALFLALGRPDHPAVFTDTGDPSETVAAFFDAACAGDWSRASSCVRGTPPLSLTAPAGDEDALILWDAYIHSWRWTAGEAVKTDDLHARQSVRFSCIRPDALTDGLTAEIQALLARRVEEADSRWDVYTEDGAYRPEVVAEALTEALTERVRQKELYRVTSESTLQLLYEDGRWQILPEESLWDLLSGLPEGMGAA